MDQLSYLALTYTGFGWNDLMELADRDRLALLERAHEHNEKQQRELDEVRNKMR